MESVRNSFVARFGEDQARKIEEAANSHKNGVHDKPGSDPFKWAILICVGYECLSAYRDEHGITAPFEEIKDWAKTEGHLDTHDGDFDYLAMFAGAYNDWMPPREAAAA